MSFRLWEELKNWKETCQWVELSRNLSLQTPHHSAFPDMEMGILYDYDRQDGFQAHVYKMPGQYGTHVDAPVHMNEQGASLDDFASKELIMPLCVLKLEDKVKENADYALQVSDILDWEAKNGRIPEGAFVAYQSGWCKRSTYEEIENRDAQGNPHYPGWSVDALVFLKEERGVAAIGHEPADTDPAPVANSVGWIAERYWLGQNCFQIELLANLDQCPEAGALILCMFPALKNGSGFTARCFAIVPGEE